MAKKPASPETDEAAPEKKRSKVKLVGAAVVLVAVGAVVGPRLMGGAEASAADPNAPTTTTTEPPGPVTVLEPITLNLADGRFLKVGLAFELAADATYPLEVPTDPADTTKGFAKELDRAISVLSKYGFEQLVSAEGKDAMKAALLAELTAISDGAITDLYFHEFVMQ